MWMPRLFVSQMRDNRGGYAKLSEILQQLMVFGMIVYSMLT